MAVLRGDELLAGCAASAGRAADSGLIPLVDEALGAAGVSLSEIEAFALTIGPGAFTSLRVGLASVKGLAFGTKRPVAAISTLEAVAWGALLTSLPSGDPSLLRGQIAALLDARRGELYAAVYTVSEGKLVPVVPEAVYRPAELASRLGERCALAGEGAALYGPEIRQLCGAGIEIIPPLLEPVAAHAVGLLGQRRLEEGGGVEAAALVPRYLMRAEAEAKRLARSSRETG